MHGRSVTGALCVAGWQVAQVLLTLPYSFSQLGMVSGVLLQIFYGLMGSWTAYLISVLYVEYRARKEKEGVSFKNHVIQVRPLVRVSVACRLPSPIPRRTPRPRRARSPRSSATVSSSVSSPASFPGRTRFLCRTHHAAFPRPGGMGIGSAGHGRSRPPCAIDRSMRAGISGSGC